MTAPKAIIINRLIAIGDNNLLKNKIAKPSIPNIKIEALLVFERVLIPTAADNKDPKTMAINAKLLKLARSTRIPMTKLIAPRINKYVCRLYIPVNNRILLAVQKLNSL